jgi:hypothetical protein
MRQFIAHFDIRRCVYLEPIFIEISLHLRIGIFLQPRIVESRASRRECPCIIRTIVRPCEDIRVLHPIETPIILIAQSTHNAFFHQFPFLDINRCERTIEYIISRSEFRCIHVNLAAIDSTHSTHSTIYRRIPSIPILPSSTFSPTHPVA